MVGLIYPIGTQLYVGARVVGCGRAVVTVSIARGEREDLIHAE
jgi:hypothetical protein